MLVTLLLVILSLLYIPVSHKKLETLSNAVLEAQPTMPKASVHYPRSTEHQKQNMSQRAQVNLYTSMFNMHLMFQWKIEKGMT